MKRIKIIVSFFIIIAGTLQSYSQSLEEKISCSFVRLEDNDRFEKLKPALKDRRIILLGEGSHFDGATFETKGKLIEYLCNELGFNTIAMEGANFASTMISHKINSKNPIGIFLLPIWQTKECYKLISIIDNKKYDVFGFDCQQSPDLFESLRRILNYDDIDYEKMALIYSKLWMPNVMIKQYGVKIAEDEELYYIETLNKLKNRIDKQLYESKNKSRDLSMLKQAIINIEVEYRLCKLTKNDPNIYAGNNTSIINYDALINYNNLRDMQMANNIIWYLDHNPKCKLIVWCANFHGARNISQCDYPKSPTMYSCQKLMGAYLSEKYGNQLYSLAFTSPGKDDSSIESHLGKCGIEYGFIDFSSLKYNDDYFDKPFKSNVIGDKIGKWMTIFDGFFFIKCEKKPTPMIRE